MMVPPAISILAGEPVLDSQMRIPAFSFCWPSAWDLEAVVGTAGASLAWLCALLGGEARFAELDAEAERSAVGANGVRFHRTWPGLRARTGRKAAVAPSLGFALPQQEGISCGPSWRAWPLSSS